MTRILRLLMIAAVALPFFGNTAAAQNASVPVKKVGISETVNTPIPVSDMNVSQEQKSGEVASQLEDGPKVVSKIMSPTMANGKSSHKGMMKANSTRGDKVTVTPPSSATAEEWSIDGTFYYYNSGWQSTTDYTAYSGSPIQVAIDGNDIYIQGLCPFVTSAWIKGTINGTTATFATGQYYGSITQNETEYEFWFVGEDDNNNSADVVFNYSAEGKRLTQVTPFICTKTSDTSGSYYNYFMNTVIHMSKSATVCDGSTYNEYVPVYGFWIDTNGTQSQMIYPSSKFTGLQAGDRIESITFYTNTANGTSSYQTATVPDNLGSATVEVRIGETTETTITSSTFSTNRTNSSVVYTGTLTTGSNTMTITFDEPYIYGGKNIIIDTYVTNGVSQKYAHCFWAGESATSGSSYNNLGSAQAFLPKMTMVWSNAVPDFALDFGNVEVGSSKTLNAVIMNPESQSVSATLTTAAPFSVANTSITMTAGTNVIPVTFTPGDALVYSGNLAIDMNGVTTNIPLTGVGNITGSPAALRDSTFFAGIEYEWTDSLGATHTSSLDEIATDPDQMIAMIREVYTNRTIPGNYNRGFTTAGVAEGDAVNYGGVGTISLTFEDNDGYYSYEDGYGWGIPGSLVVGSSTSSINNYMSGTAYYCSMNPEQYKPYNEGVTLLLVEMVDDFDKSTMYDTEETEPYNQLRDYISNSIKSIRIVNEAKRTGTGYDAGTLFKIDCDKMNKFYFMAKGQLRWIYNSVFAEDTDGDVLRGLFCADPCYIYNTSSSNSINKFCDDRSFPLFYNMFEEFSPVANDASAAKADIYQDLINMESFGVEHDCMGVPLMGHQFMMYGEDSGAADCQDVRDMMFFVPDYRMMSWSGRDNENNPNYQKFMNYNTSHQPTVGLYVIRQDEIQGQQVTGKEMYKLTLTWDSNLDDFLPSDQQVYYLLQVVLHEDGTEEYVPVYYMNSDGQYTDKNGNVVTTPVPIELTFNPGATLTYTEVYVPMQQTSQQVTYAVRGQDITKFLDLKVSNKRDFIIPGLDPNEMIKLTDATHYSRFNPQTVENCYSNKLQMVNNAIGINNKIIVDGENGTKLNVIRSHVETVNGANTTVDETIATITFNNHASSNRSWTVTMNMATQSDKTEFPAGQSDVEGGNVQYYAGYHANPGNSWTKNYSISSNGNIILSPAIVIYDNFVVDVSENTHPSGYTYRLETNYPGAVYLNTNNNGTDYTNGAVWYAWTWNTTGVDEEWIQGRATSQTGQYMFTPLKNNFIFVRMNPSGAPDWSAKWNQTGDLTKQGDTYTITGWGSQDMTGTWSGSNDATAYSNDFRIPVYKANSKINSTFTKDQVDGDVTGYMDIDENLAFGVNVQYSSKTEILRYDAYRWGETEDRYIVDKVRNYDDEDDIAPTGIAGNQDGSYSVSMNEVGTSNYYTSSVSVGSGEDDKWAEFVDFVPSQQTVGTAYTYAPVVELFTFGKDVNDKVREDYNTYGGPLQTSAMGKLAISLVEPNSSNPLMSDYTWEDENHNKYAYYNIKFNVATKSVPPGYEIYKIRAWREIDESLLGEQYEACEDRLSDSYKFEELTYPEYDKNETYVLGSKEVNLTIDGHAAIEGNCTGTFGARKLRTSDDETGVIEELDACFFVRIYFTRTSNLTGGQKGPRADQEPDLPADGKYYVVEASYDFVAEGGEDVPTGVIKNLNVRQVVSEKYYNPAGVESDTPFQGVNIVVTRYSDGSATTTKILK